MNDPLGVAGLAGAQCLRFEQHGLVAEFTQPRQQPQPRDTATEDRYIDMN